MPRLNDIFPISGANASSISSVGIAHMVI
jgi:hypothetical protein